MSKCLVVLSGGQDSTTCLFIAKQEFDEVFAVTYDYNQRHIREIYAARCVSRIAGVVSHEVVTVGPILRGRSPLTNMNENLELYENYTEMDAIIGDRRELTFVPMRNALFLTLAANFAVSMDIFDIYTGVCEADNANYSDCRQSFIDSQRMTINQALGISNFNIITPLITTSKADSIKLAVSMKDPYLALAFSHTAYDGMYPPVGKDHASTLRAQGFLEAGVPDPLVIRAWSEKAMELPDTPNYKDAEINNNLARIIHELRMKHDIKL